VGHTQESEFLYKGIGERILGANEARYKMDLHGFGDNIQIGRYGVGDFYNWHLDSGNHHFSKRKLSAIVQLSDETDYEGGDIEIITKGLITRARGTMIVFPSYMAHRVLAVTKGVRYSAVAWIHGPPYR